MSDSVSPREQALHDALRRLAIKHPRYGPDGIGVTLDELACALCDGRWTAHSTEKHAPGCLAAPAAQQPVADAPIVAWRIDYHKPCAGDVEYLSWRDIEPPETLVERIAKLQSYGHTCTPLYEAQLVADGRADALPELTAIKLSIAILYWSHAVWLHKDCPKHGSSARDRYESALDNLAELAGIEIGGCSSWSGERVWKLMGDAVDAERAYLKEHDEHSR